jgi:hypothetical protein
MPKLSKFRVVNLIYNDTRHIYDETFDFNEGDNAMMLLANGGGKTVLTQMMLQTVIPKTDLKTRKFSDYFKNNHRPTVLMSEWKLDSQGGTLLTGLVVKNRIRKKRGGEEDRETLDIHAFTIQYHYHETWNIDNIPVINRDDGGRKTMRRYDDLIQDLSKHQNKHGEFVSLFKWSDSSEAKRQYRNKLAEYGIVQQEWTDNILKINKEEAGLKSFFEDAKSSHALLRKKILPVIENKLEKNNMDNVELQTLVKNYASEFVKNDKIINDEKTYNGFLNDSIEYENSVENLDRINEELENAYGDIGRIYWGLRSLSIEMKKASDTAEACILLNEEEIRNIGFEKECYKYYSDIDGIKEIEKECSLLIEELEKFKKECDGADNDMKCQKAAELYDLINEDKSKIDREQARLKQRMADEDEEQFELIARILQEKYNQLKKESEKICNNLRIEKEELIIQKKENSNDIERLALEIDSIRSDQTEKNLLIKQFDDKVKELNERNRDFQWNKNPLIDDYEPSLLRNYNNNLEGRKNDIFERNSSLESESGNAEEKIKSLDRENKEKEIEKSSLTQQLKQAETRLHDYKKEYASVFEEVRVYGFDEERFHDNELLAQELNLIVSEKETELKHLTLEKSMVMEASESLKAGRLYSLPEEFVDFLDRESIGFQYGYKWLLDYEGEKLPRTLHTEYLKILPYSLIVEENDLIRFREAAKNYNIERVIPMVSYQFIAGIIDNEDSDIERDGLLLHTSFDEKLLETDYVKNKVDSYEDRLINIDTNSEVIKKSLEVVRGVIFGYKNFVSRYDSDSFDKLTHSVQGLKEVIERLESETKANSEAIEKINDSLKEMASATKEIEKKLKHLEKTIELYLDIEKEYKNYTANREERARIRKTLKENKSKLDGLKKSLDKLAEGINDLDRKLVDGRFGIENIENKKTALGLSESEKWKSETLERHELFMESIDQLEGRYGEHEKKSGDIEDIKKLIGTYSEYMKKNEVELKSLRLVEEDYIDISYDLERLVILDAEVKILRQKIADQDKSISSKEGIIHDRQKKCNELKEAILERYRREEIFPREKLIDVDFKKRISEKKAEIDEFKKSGKEYLNIKMKSDNSMLRLKDVAGDSLKDIQPNEYGIGTSDADIDRICGDIVKKTNGIKSNRRDIVDKIRILYDRLCGDYSSNELLGNMFRNLLNGDNIYRYDFVKRVLSQTRESIDRTLKKYEADLKTMKDKASALYKFALTRVSDVYDELDDIDRHSYIEIDDKRHKMMNIKLPKKENLDTSHVENHLKEVIRRTKSKIENDDVSDLDKYLDSHLKLEQIFDQYVPLKNIRINISKIEQNNISRISWEDVSKTSGGEVFVSVFVLFISLMSYTRGFQIGKKQQGKVIVMDNPFGPVSSGHLLEPLFKIAKTYNTQLICFTHINTSAITNQFELIYSLRVIREAGSSREHLEAKIAKDEKQAVEIIESSLFEIGDGDQLGFV